MFLLPLARQASVDRRATFCHSGCSLYDTRRQSIDTRITSFYIVTFIIVFNFSAKVLLTNCTGHRHVLLLIFDNIIKYTLYQRT